MTKDELLKLADRCEWEEATFALDRAIMYAVYDVRPEHRSTGDKPKPYTTSLDAAVTLVPEGWLWSVDCQVCKLVEGAVWKAASRFLVCDDVERYGHHREAAAALTAAALRARAADMQARAVPSPEQKGSEQ